MKNKFCNIIDLGNEASVESRFVDKLIEVLGFKSSEIKLKASLRELKVGKGSRSSLYKPDYSILSSGLPTLIVDAKATTEDISSYEQQCSSYCLEINKAYDHNPVKYYMLSNGLKTSLYEWDMQKPILSLDFQDFSDQNPKYQKLISIIGRDPLALAAEEQIESLNNTIFDFDPITIDELGVRFQKIHQYIWTKESKMPSAAFDELMKIVFVKMQKDREIHHKLGKEQKPKYKDVVFSTHWMNNQTENESPINDPLFRNLVKSLEEEIRSARKKRIFADNEIIHLGKDTIRWIVNELQHIDFVSMEEDIHGRMFETFLDATVRGRDIGQFFTPRDIVDLMIRLAQITVTKTQVPKVLDACCGSGGFLISAMRQMIAQTDGLTGCTTKEMASLLETIKNESIYGIDAGSDPAMYKIARMNMYLHGDGGSHIYHADSLDKTLGAVGNSSIESDSQLNELRDTIITKSIKFDVILSNPPFSLKYVRDNGVQERVLNQYETSVNKEKGKVLKSLLSSVMFLERYRDLVSDDGKILAIIDDSVLSGDAYEHIRCYIRQNFIIVGIISLPGDAFRRASARVKTSIMVLRKRAENESQNDVFMASTICLGVEKKIARRIGIDVTKLNQQRSSEANAIIASFTDYMAGKPGAYAIPASKMRNRMDVKFCLHDGGRKAGLWRSKNLAVCTVRDVLTPAIDRGVVVDEETEYQFLRVNYDGVVIDGDIIDGQECSYSILYTVEPWDILISNMGVGRGAVGIVPPFHAGKYVSNEYTILLAGSEEEAVYYCSLLRTKEILADILAGTTGMNRGRIKWESISNVCVPKYQAGNTDIIAITTDLKNYWSAFSRYTDKQKKHMDAVTAELDVDGPESYRRWLSFKPPE